MLCKSTCGGYLQDNVPARVGVTALQLNLRLETEFGTVATRLAMSHSTARMTSVSWS